MKKLSELQNKVKAPKGQYNSFGKYNYRSLEDITEAVKPIALEIGLTLTVTDEMVLVGDRYYIKATATAKDNETGEIETVTAYAREPEDKKGMDASQITGTASSYARKYAFNGLLMLDDTKDADTDEHARTTQKTTARGKQDQPDQKKLDNYVDKMASAKINDFEIQAILELCTVKNFDFKKIEEGYGKKLKELTSAEAQASLRKLQAM